MILPHSYFAIVLLMILGAVCWGSWVGALKMAGKWRFELFAIDMAFGFAAVCLLCSLVLGNSGYDGFSLVDDVMHAGKQQWAFTVAGGILFALSNLFLLAASSIGGLAVAFTAAFGSAVIVQGVIDYFSASAGTSATILGAGALLVAAAIVVASAVHSSLVRQRHEVLAKAGRAKSTRRPSGAKPIALGILSGLLMAGWRPLVQKGMQGEIGLGPYSATVFLAFGAVFSTLAFGIFFIFLPVEGEPLDMSSIFQGTVRQHLLGWLGGGILALAVVARLVAIAANSDSGLGGGLPAGAKPVTGLLAFVLGYVAPVFAAVLGFLVFRELKDDTRGPSHWIAAAMPILFLGGLVLIALSAPNSILP